MTQKNYQPIPKLDQLTQMVLQLEPKDDYYEVAVVNIPPEQLEEKAVELIEGAEKPQPVEYKIVPVSKEGLTTKAALTAAGFVVVEEAEIIKDAEAK